MNVKHKARILIIDDELDLREILSSTLVEHFTDIVTADCYAEAISELEKCEFDVIVCDYKLNGKTGLDIRNWQMKHQPQCQFILLTGYSEDPGIVTHLETDHFKVLQKPAHPNELILPLKRQFPKKGAA